MPDKIVIPKTNTLKSESFIGSAINLLKEIRIISGVNSRSNSICYKSSVEFDFINKMIDKFKDKYELKGFKK